MRPADNIERHIKNNKLHVCSSSQMDEKILSDSFDAMEQAMQEKQADGRPDIWRNIMQSKISKLAVAAIIIVAALIGINQFGGSIDGSGIAWADVIKPILNAQTASLDIIIGSGEQKTVIHDEVMGSRIRRTVSNVSHSDIIIDLEQKKLLTLDHSKKIAVFIQLDGLGDLQNYIELVRNVVTRIEDNPDFQVANLGLQEIDGRSYAVFFAESNKESITIWADPETGLPLRIEQKTPNMRILCDNMEFDVPFDESRFSMEIPDGYVVQNTGIDFKNGNEDAFIETLRIWAEVIEDGRFPESIDLKDIVKTGPKFDKGLKKANLTDQEQIEIATRWGQGLVFIRFFKGEGKWHYAGKGVELGNGDAPIFWYRPKDSPTWRVIYGDLHVEEFAKGDLPK